MMHCRGLPLTFAAVLAVLAAAAAAQGPVPPPTPPPNQSNVYANGRIYDISHLVGNPGPAYGTRGPASGTSKPFDDPPIASDAYLIHWSRFEPGKLKTQVMEWSTPAHVVTHVDAPSHAIPKWQDAGYGADTLDLDTLNGPGLLVDVPRDKNITAEVLQSLNIPKGVKRVLFRTSNTDRRLMWKPFESNYTGFTLDGAEYLVKNTDIKLIGIDYLSVAIGSKAEAYVPPHQVLLENRDIIPVEGLNLLNVPAGAYDIRCLPLRLPDADGAPTRCILIK